MKPTLTAEQSDALTEGLKNLAPPTILCLHSNDPNKWCSYAKPLNGLNIMTLAAALVNGWETEVSPIDLLRGEYQRVVDLRDADSNVAYWCRGVIETLEATGQRIEGINA